MPDPLSDPLARELAKLAPAPTAVTSAAVLYAAGKQAAERKANHWRTATGALSLLFVCSWVGMTMRPSETKRSETTYDFARTVPPPMASSPRVEDPKLDTPLSPAKPIPLLVATDRPSEDTLEERAKGIRLMRDILAGGLGMIPEAPRGEPRRVPNSASMEMNPAVLGGYYAPKKEE